MIFLVAGTVWYTNEKQISSIRLECAELCKRTSPIPFEQKTIRDAGELEKFKQAMSQGRKLLGDIDYGVVFWMYITLRDGTRKKYVLNINEQPGGIALLVNMKSGNAYTLPKDDTAAMRAIIWHG
jgi:hypothetical protein